MTSIVASLLLLLWLATGSCLAAGAGHADVEARMQGAPKPHPRLLWVKGGEEALKQKIAADPALSAALKASLAEADKMLDEAPVERKLIGRRLLDKSRTCLKRVLCWSFAHRITGERKYADRARKEMLAAAAFPDWNPSHFLDVAEMTAALALGYDWLYDALDAESRATIRQAILEKGLKPSLLQKGWVRGNNNWNQVCNGGMTLGALAVWEDEPALAKNVVTRAVEGVPYAMAQYAPDGAYPEGPGYWGYGTSYNVVLIAALETALGTDFGLVDTPGFLATADYYLHATGPTGLFFNYSDCGSGSGPEPAMYWFAARRKEPSLLWTEHQKLASKQSQSGGKSGWRTDRLFPLLLVWAPSIEAKRPAEAHWSGHGVTPVAMHRSGWDASAVYVAAKGGSPSANHAHMDVGTFVMDADGVRWAEDLGAQDYHSLESKGIDLWNGKQDSQRWKVFRIGSFSHNILTVNGQSQLVKGKAPLLSSTPEKTVIDLSSVYAGQLAKAVRSVELRAGSAGVPAGGSAGVPAGGSAGVPAGGSAGLRAGGGAGLRAGFAVVIQDEIETAAAATIRWGMVTSADVKLAGGGGAAAECATLQKNGKKLTFQVLSPAGVTIKTYQTDPPPGETDARNEGTRMIGFEVSLPASTSQKLIVVLTPAGPASGAGAGQ
ncbi:MAG TPA: heparinase II/III family protein [Planctomycetota bacterium]|jgi:hypothetical protein